MKFSESPLSGFQGGTRMCEQKNGQPWQS